MKHIHLLATATILAAVAMTGCTSKPVVKSVNSSSALTGTDGASTNGLNENGGLNGTALDAVHQALLGRVVHFDYDSSEIAQSDYSVLNAHASYLASNGAAHVTLVGNTDERGTREYNMALGERRAKSVQSYLETNGAHSNQVDVVSYGKEKPVDDGHDESAWAKNRRVEIQYDKLDPNQQ